jgi:hypothetical protein
MIFRDGAVQSLLETVYTCLTNRKIENARPKNEEELIPPFARATAVQVTPRRAAASRMFVCERLFSHGARKGPSGAAEGQRAQVHLH